MDEPRINADQPFRKKPSQPDVEQQEFDREKQLDQSKCANCGSSTPEPGHKVPLCKDCRDKLSRYPIPIFIIVSLIAVLGLTIMAFTKFPESLKAGVAFSKGQKAEKAGKYEDAYNNYLEAMDTYKNSTQILARIGITSFKAGEYDAAALNLNKLAGKELSKELAAEVNYAVAGIDKYYDGQKKAQETAKKSSSKKPDKRKKGGAR